MKTIRAEEATVDALLSSFHAANRAVNPTDATIVLNGASIAGWLLWMAQDLHGAIELFDRLPRNEPWCRAEMYLRGAEHNARALPRASGDGR